MSAIPQHFPHETVQHEPIRSRDKIFWLAIREALLLMVRAIEKAYLPDISKKT